VTHDLGDIRFVLHRPRGAINVGAAARALANMGLRQLVIVRNGPLRPAWVRAMAAHAGGVVDSMRRCTTIHEAIAGCALVVGTTSRSRQYWPDPQPVRSLVSDIVARAASQAVAIVFGPEDHGLSNAELKLCHRTMTIPADDAYPSLNLAQAVMICAYELFLASTQTAAVDDRSPLAPVESLEAMYERLQRAFLSIGFLNRDNPDHVMLALRRLLGRTGLEEREVRILLGLARQIEWYGRESGRGITPSSTGAETTWRRS
jgi:tRNA/rRNA methyltransferase